MPEDNLYPTFGFGSKLRLFSIYPAGKTRSVS